MSEAPTGRTKAFLSYSHKDPSYLEEFQKHLTYFERNGLLELWVDTKIAPGQRWFDEIRAGLASTRAANFLVAFAVKEKEAAHGDHTQRLTPFQHRASRVFYRRGPH